MGDDNDAPSQQESIVQLLLQLARADTARRDQLYNSLVAPAIQGQAPSFFRNAVRPSIESGFAGARENLMGFFGRSGQGISGLAAGPLANLESAEAQAISNSEMQAILSAIGIGSGQGFFNPGQYLASAAGANASLLQQPNYGNSLWGSLVGTGVSAIPWPQGGGGWGGGWGWG